MVRFAALILTFCFTTSALAQTEKEIVTAADPDAMVVVLQNAGYDVELTKDQVDDPLIIIELAGFSSRIYFYGCDSTSHTGCDAVQFATGFDRDQPWTAAEAIRISKDMRFASIQLDEEGDPFITWDVITGNGIPASVFLKSVLSYTRTLEDAGDIIFADGTE